jgi:hypothetical protein
VILLSIGRLSSLSETTLKSQPRTCIFVLAEFFAQYHDRKHPTNPSDQITILFLLETFLPSIFIAVGFNGDLNKTCISIPLYCPEEGRLATMILEDSFCYPIKRSRRFWRTSCHDVCRKYENDESVREEARFYIQKEDRPSHLSISKVPKR